MVSTHAFVISKHGGPEVLEYVEIEVPAPGPNEIQIEQVAIGLNFADIYQRKGAPGPHASANFPDIIGAAGSGRVTACGDAVTDFSVGDLVTYLQPGAYSVTRNVEAARALPIPAGLDPETAAGTLLRGMTAEYLLNRLFKVEAGQSVLVHAAAGGMGQILSAWASALGATVIGTVGSEAKMEVAAKAGCHHVLNYRTTDFAREVLSLTNGRGVDVVYDAIGRDVFVRSLECLRVRGMAINYGTASGDVEGFPLQLLHSKSLSVCRPTLRSFVATPAELRQSANDYAAQVRSGAVRADIARRYPFSKTPDAHRDLEAGQTTGAGVLVPGLEVA